MALRSIFPIFAHIITRPEAMNTCNQRHNTLKHRGLIPPPISQCDVNNAYSKAATPTLLHRAMALCGGVFVCLLFALGLSSCEKEVLRYEEMVQYHAESLTLPSVAVDSVGRFEQKVEGFVALHPAAAEDPLFPEILDNIRQALVRFNLTLDPDWEIYYSGTF